MFKVRLVEQPQVTQTTTANPNAASNSGANLQAEPAPQAQPVLAGSTAPRAGTLRTSHGDDDGDGAARKPAATRTANAPRVGRNDPCFCGSGKKYKKCHGAV